ncbi:MAG: ABC transporter ATP-binding protein [Ferrimicrobium sp.]|uniref:ATP-binding cassette domain-containing protein n=1 Tax=Ferrimicrobium acidiphilum TaxID=121039 RepID=A0ABV3Y146_9ACTN|nr:ABC transporter ATP-binding protein [Ferrimicrobium sp.]MCL5974086.1 ABC transporter ATP-binding protein [Actinomycetota bacterium]
MTSVIEVDGLTKRLGAQRAVDGVSFSVSQGSVFGFLGPNGAGKTTTIRIIVGLIYPDAGSFSLLGEHKSSRLHRVLPRVGSFIEGPGYVPYLSARQNLDRFLAAEGVHRRGRAPLIANALEAVGLEMVMDKPVGRYSLGMRQRLGLAQALLGDRDLYILDEPTNGLDPSGMREVRRLIGELASLGKTVFISTHLLSEAEQICSHVAFMSQGRLIKTGELGELRSGYPQRLRVVGSPIGRLRALMGPSARSEGSSVLVDCDPKDGPQLLKSLLADGIEVSEFSWITPSLEDIFIAEVGEGFDVR